MRRIAVTACALAALSGWTVAAHAADAPGLGGPAAKLVACDLTGTDRSATFSGRMDVLPGASRLAMRFTLLERLGRGSSWQKVDVPALRAWHRSAPGVKTFVYKQTVDKLRTGAAYRARIQYRWSTAAGTPVQSEARETPVCRGALPNLEIEALDSRSGPTADTRTYRVTVANVGRADADDVDVVLSVDRALLDAVTISSLDAGDSRTVSFTGPACANAVRVRVDPENTIGELLEGDNAQLFGCPE